MPLNLKEVLELKRQLENELLTEKDESRRNALKEEVTSIQKVIRSLK